MDLQSTCAHTTPLLLAEHQARCSSGVHVCCCCCWIQCWCVLLPQIVADVLPPAAAPCVWPVLPPFCCTVKLYVDYAMTPSVVRVLGPRGVGCVVQSSLAPAPLLLPTE